MLWSEIRDVCVTAEVVLDVEVSFPRLKLWSKIRDVCVAAEVVLDVEVSYGQKLETSV